jgi:hypothetical protein
MTVDQLRSDLIEGPVDGGAAAATYLSVLDGVPICSKAMLVSKVRMPSESAVNCHPLRPPGTLKAVKAPATSELMPAFLIHFS